MKISFKKFQGALLFAVMLGSGVIQAEDGVQYTFCRSLLTEGVMPWGDSQWVVSSVFRNNLPVMRTDMGIKNSFDNFIEAELGGHARMAICFHHNSYQDAADERNKLIAGYRNSGDKFTTVRWSYYGD